MRTVPNVGSGSVKASFPTLSVGKETFTDRRVGCWSRSTPRGKAGLKGPFAHQTLRKPLSQPSTLRKWLSQRACPASDGRGTR
ncbi:Hypothetical protein AJAP_26840 [Amycolatopsis japonica]|uniref:Uncharacterized protein n=1 Tax=Amycolatopsis japonica TaxID=208439 RepID=A0A075V5M9_9PSEU|nr:Hypothetical protein AJAP_26840 [Amycolatopsis japonica]